MDCLYQYTAPVFIKTLGGLRAVLGKAREHGLNETALMEDRLAPDMFPFVKQVQSACDNAKGAVARLAGMAPPALDDVEKSLAELQARIDKTIAFLQSVSEESYAGAAERRIVLPYFKEKYMAGYDYAREYAIPNFFFHVSMAYALVRRQGVAVGKADYINGMPLKDL